MFFQDFVIEVGSPPSAAGAVPADGTSSLVKANSAYCTSGPRSGLCDEPWDIGCEADSGVFMVERPDMSNFRGLR